MDLLKPPEPLQLSGNLSQNWKRFKQKLELFIKATTPKDDPRSGAAKAALLLSVAGDEALDVFNTFTLGEQEDKEDYDTLVRKFEAYCAEVSNEVHERALVNEVGAQFNDEFDVLDVCIDSCITGDWTVEAKVGGRKALFKVDTGAQASLLPFSIYRKLKTAELNPTSSVLRAYNGGIITNFGTTVQKITVGDAATTVKFYVVKNGRRAILGLHACEALGLVQRTVDTVNTSAEYEAIKHFRHVFEGLGCLKQPYSMVLQPDATPVVQPARRVPLSLRQPLRDELQRMERAGIITKEDGPTDWYVPGKHLVLADMLSRSTTPGGVDNAGATEDVEVHALQLLNGMVTETTQQKLAKETARDCYLQTVVSNLSAGNPIQDVERLPDTSARSVVAALSAMFARYGIPIELCTDNGPQFSSQEFAAFAKEYDFAHVTSSPHYPQSNGLAEKGVQIVKRIMKKTQDARHDFWLGLLAYRSTLLIDGQSPGELLQGRRLRSNLPDFGGIKTIEVKKHRQTPKGQPLPQLGKGDVVRLRDTTWSQKGKVVGEAAPRSYHVVTESRRVLRRNRRHLLHSSEQYAETSDDDTDDDCADEADPNARNSPGSVTPQPYGTTSAAPQQPPGLCDQHLAHGATPSASITHPEQPTSVISLRRSTRTASLRYDAAFNQLS
ncbi:uncharacterized protein LOC144133441 [Amblyomma americanum]